MRTNIPSFRLPEKVLKRSAMPSWKWGRCSLQISGHEHASAPGGAIRRRLRRSGAPRGKDLQAPRALRGGLQHSRGIDWLESIAFKHLDRNR